MILFRAFSFEPSFLNIVSSLLIPYAVLWLRLKSLKRPVNVLYSLLVFSSLVLGSRSGLLVCILSLLIALLFFKCLFRPAPATRLLHISARNLRIFFASIVSAVIAGSFFYVRVISASDLGSSASNTIRFLLAASCWNRFANGNLLTGSGFNPLPNESDFLNIAKLSPFFSEVDGWISSDYYTCLNSHVHALLDGGILFYTVLVLLILSPYWILLSYLRKTRGSLDLTNSKLVIPLWSSLYLFLGLSALNDFVAGQIYFIIACNYFATYSLLRRSSLI
jgi:hypothetical protein